MIGANDALTMFVLVSIVAPILEEVVFREAIIGLEIAQRSRINVYFSVSIRATYARFQKIQV